MELLERDCARKPRQPARPTSDLYLWNLQKTGGEYARYDL